MTRVVRPSCTCPHRSSKSFVFLPPARIKFRLAGTKAAVEPREEGAERSWPSSTRESLPEPENTPSSSTLHQPPTPLDQPSARLTSTSSADAKSLGADTRNKVRTQASNQEQRGASSRFALNSPIVTAMTSKYITLEVKARLTEWSTSVMQHSKQVAQGAEKQLVDLGLKVNQMTGYQEVERLKALVFQKEDELQKLRESARGIKAAYEEAVSARSAAQRDVNSLLERKHSWTDADVSRFTSLVRADHASTHAVASTSVQLKESEIAVDKAFSDLMQTILQRYHEEQVWSDKIRSVSTWANLIGLALNLVIFVGAVAVVEPWKRRRLVERLEERMAGMMEKVDRRLGGVESHLLNVAALETARDLPQDLDFKEGLESSMVGSSLSVQEKAIGTSESPLGSSKPDSLATLPTPFFLTDSIRGLPPYLDVVAQPSQERDLAVAGLAGAIAATTLMTLGRWLFSR
ncbi:hypothetical protein IAR55_003397 [Kwoniella newhampshirensis]|uniref:Sensitive to high expression protein 9, mitochondrial n=1 Tax=Kwoniella newhampshirensis TaxID=1651941 RepID=A0AAW0Z1C3_9TREE